MHKSQKWQIREHIKLQHKSRTLVRHTVRAHFFNEKGVALQSRDTVVREGRQTMQSGNEMNGVLACYDANDVVTKSILLIYGVN